MSTRKRPAGQEQETEVHAPAPPPAIVDYSIEAVLGRGLRALGEAIDDMAAKPTAERDDRYHAHNLAKCVEGVAKLQAEARAKLEFDRKNDLLSDVQGAVEEFLSGLEPSEVTTLLERARSRAVAS